MRNIGLDIGDKRIGIAISDPEEILATPLDTLIRIDDDKAIQSVQQLITKYDIKRLVVGIPYSLSGESSQQTLKTKEFVNKLAVLSDVEVIMQDERLTTRTARSLIFGLSKKKSVKKGTLDAATAAVILQSYLDSKIVEKSLKETLNGEIDNN